MTIQKAPSIAIVGATGSVGRELVTALQESDVLLAEPILLASEHSLGEDVGGVPVADAAQADFKNIDIALFAMPAGPASRELQDRARRAGAMVVDASDLHATDLKVPMVATGFNDDAIKTVRDTKLVTIPTPLAYSLSRLLRGIGDKFPIERVTTSTYQAVTGAGIKAMQEVVAQSIALLGGGSDDGGFSSEAFAHQAAFNVLPQVGPFLEDGATGAEHALVRDTRRLLNQPNLPMSVTCAYVPIFVGEAMSLTLQFAPGTAPTPQAIRDLFGPASGIIVLDVPKENEYATPYGSAETSYMFLSRVRADAAAPDTLSMWLVADHLRVAVARNMASIAEKLAFELN